MFIASATAVAQEAPRPWRLAAFFWHDSPNDARALEGIRAALNARGRPFELEVRTAAEDRERAARELRELEAADLDLVFALGTQAALLCREHIRSAPIVFTAVTNPVESGLAPSWAGSGGPVAGNSNWIAPGTVLEVFRMAVPDLERLGVLRSRPQGVVSAAEVREMQDLLAAQRAGRRVLRVPQLVEEVIDRPEELGEATRRLLARGVEAIWIPIDFAVYEHLDRILPIAAERGVPLLSSSLRGTQTGAIAGVLVDYEMLGERSVVIALRILDGGEAPGVIPISRMHGYQVVVNLAAAERVGYELPLPLLVIADVIHEQMKPGEGDGRGR